MANKMRWKYGDTNPVMLNVGSATVVEIGDLLFQDAGLAVPASLMDDLGTKAANQEAFHDGFAGVAMQHSPEGSTDPIRVATTGVFEMDCASATFTVGDLLGADENGAGTGLEDQVVVKVATPNLAVGRCPKRVNPAASRVLVQIEGTTMHGGPQAAA